MYNFHSNNRWTKRVIKNGVPGVQHEYAMPSDPPVLFSTVNKEIHFIYRNRTETISFDDVDRFEYESQSTQAGIPLSRTLTFWLRSIEKPRVDVFMPSNGRDWVQRIKLMLGD
ncbi:hypothetical protein [Azospirillum argentinense]